MRAWVSLISVAAPLALSTLAFADEFDCRTTGMGSMRCSQSSHDRIHQDFVNRSRNQLKEHDETIQRLRDARREKEAKQERRWRETLGKAVLEGRCDDAKRMALERGDLEAADQATRLCVPATAAAPAMTGSELGAAPIATQ